MDPRAKVTKKLKIFIWLMFIDRSGNLLKIKKIRFNGMITVVSSATYILSTPTTCSSNAPLLLNVGIYLISIGAMTFFDAIKKREKSVVTDFFFMEIFSIHAWEIWKQHNSKIFIAEMASFHSRRDNFFSTMRHQMYRLSEDNRLKI
jgi:hypothetical protein